MAGLLTLFPQTMPSQIYIQWQKEFMLAPIRNIQQRDCPGFSPDSLLIAILNKELRTNASQK